MFKDWKIKKSDYEKSVSIQKAYSEVAKWCQKSGKFFIEDAGDSYVVRMDSDIDTEELNQFKSSLFQARMADTVYEEISPTTYLNVMIKL